MLVLLITQATTHVSGQISSLKICTSLLGVIQKAMLFSPSLVCGSSLFWGETHLAHYPNAVKVKYMH